MELNQITEFQSSAAILQRLHEYGIPRTFSEGEVIMRESAYVRAIPIVTEGSVKVMRTDPDGREILLYYIRPGESCIMSFLGGMHQETSKVKAVADKDTQILMIPVEKLSELMREFPEWLDYIFKLYHKRFEELLEVVNAVAFKRMDERLLDFIRKKSELSGDNAVHMTHEQIAHELGTARVVVSRLLKQMEEEKLVELSRNKITLL
ncbi:MAG TPA: Crp/Fnr family transcriptional regulator [Cryomorphaceae bacterium]|nr:Crp/Fnr family transcriptional regulator [Owenweeksia sp.]MBF98394.1 Crp/Fnr family transcriptional regulator [Owenweeksia sp.]HAD98314.1 Crp/Fnr family transcriptional regulator [Cryomorphaceae bacterium]HBF20423.1 Crp/Fnr family transcriptional regulator [Cryomorphaceae bacterium]HCQ14894.1 Crp/Fnr family transcriptional regulator [Cryomorphaceae bacterium]|tara:strand:+ start:657 stop:1277 length:621 start_codon:yes stop_codon:yes gene_type:complete